MLKLREKIKVYMYAKFVDMRKAVNGLSGIMIDEKLGDPGSGDLIIFYNRKKDKLKILFWDRNGFVLYYKCLQQGKFKIPKNSDGKLELTQDQLDWLLAGLDFHAMSNFSELNYCNYY